MPSVTYNGQSFSVDGRRIWILGAAIQYTRVPAPLWSARIAAAKQAGFNTIATACPWSVHEPRRGRYEFSGDANVRLFMQMCWSHGMRVILRPGPYIGDQFDGGGLPGWLIETPGVVLREDNDIFLEHVSTYFRKLLGELSELQATSNGGGPILLVQSEHAWMCSNDEQAQSYLHEVTRLIRESGMTVPVINANDLWQESPGTIDTWRGYDDLLAHLRQVRSVQTNAPRLVTEFDAAALQMWRAGGRAGAGGAASTEKSPANVLRRLAEILAGGAQPVVWPFHGGTNFGFLAGRVAGGPEGFVCTTAAVDAPLGEDGERGEKYHALRRLIMFANHFGHVFAELDPEYQPVVVEPQAHEDEGSPRHKSPSGHVSVVPLRGPQGRIVFVFGDESTRNVTLVLDDGVRLPVHLGDQGVGWIALDVDLQGLGRLDYTSLCPWGIVDRSIVVLHGPAKAQAYLSISDTPFDITVPAEGAKPLILQERNLTIVVCNQAQIDATYHTDSALYVGIGGLGTDGSPRAHADFPKAWMIRREGKMQEVDLHGVAKVGRGGPKSDRSRTTERAVALSEWQAASASAYVSGESPRFASLEGPEPLSACGAPSGYGWYRIDLRDSGKKSVHIPQARDRIHVYADGRLQHVFGDGAGAKHGPFALTLSKESRTLVALADNFGRFSEGNDLRQPKGIFGHVYEVKPLRVPKPKVQSAQPVNPFELRGFIAGLSAGQLSDSRQLVWVFNHTKKTPIVIDVQGARASGTFVLNDQLVAYYAGATGGCGDRILLDPATNKALKRGRNVLRFAPDARQDGAAEQIGKSTSIYQCVDVLSSEDGWAFAKWEAPSNAEFGAIARGEYRSVKGLPCWWRSSFQAEGDAKAPMRESGSYWLDVSGLSKGQAYVNGQNLGRYFTATPDGKALGAQTRLYVPACWLKPGQANDVMLFDEHGFDPSRVKLVHRAG